MAELQVPHFAEATGRTIVIDGVTYRPPLVASDGRIEARVFGLDVATQRQLSVDPGGRLRVALDVDADDYRTANENYAAAQTNNELIAAPGAGLQIIVIGVQFSTAVAGNFKLVRNTGAPVDIYGPHYFPANGGMVIAPGRIVVSLTADQNLGITTSVAGAHSISIQAVVV